LVSRLQTQLGLTKQESQQAVKRLFEILKDHPRQWRRPAHQRLWEIFGKAKECPAGQESSDEGEFDPVSEEGFGV